VVERDLAKVDVAGSTPVSRSSFSEQIAKGSADSFSKGRIRDFATLRNFAEVVALLRLDFSFLKR
jgi:hypothetical protein